MRVPQTRNALVLALPASPKWAKVAAGLEYARDKSGMILAYEGFTERTKAKQADALLLFHPGELELPEAEVAKMYDYFAPRVIRNGPAMTESIHAIIAARLGRGDEALKRFQESYRPFVRPPYSVFSEKRTKDNVCFLTGAAGVIESVLYGFGGLHLRDDPAHPDRMLLKPHLPPDTPEPKFAELHNSNTK